nr:serine hydrolase [Luteimonas salinisoli]
MDDAAALAPLRTVVVARHGEVLAERGYRGHSPARPANIKSASKPVVTALVGIAIERGLLAGEAQKIAPLLEDALPADPDPRLYEVTLAHLLSMRAGLGRTSGSHYGRWVASDDWVRAALARPFEDEPGGEMLYSTGSTHLLSAILTRASGRDALDLAREWLGAQPGFAISAWDRDPQGIRFGGNQMAMTPRSLLAFGELYRNGGRSADGRQVIPRAWVDASWRPRTRSRYSGDGYGYGWFLRRIGGEEVRYAWGYGGQMLYVVPALQLTVAMTSDERHPSGSGGYRDQLHALLAEIVATQRAPATPATAPGGGGPAAP